VPSGVRVLQEARCPATTPQVLAVRTVEKVDAEALERLEAIDLIQSDSPQRRVTLACGRWRACSLRALLLYAHAFVAALQP
jgi:hypothetical protein